MNKILILNLLFISSIDFQSHANEQLVNVQKNIMQPSNDGKVDNKGNSEIEWFKPKLYKKDVTKIEIDSPISKSEFALENSPFLDGIVNGVIIGISCIMILPVICFGGYLLYFVVRNIIG